MNLQEMYPKEWDDLTEQKVPKKEINEYLLRFVARLLREVKAGKRKDIDLGDGFSIGKFAMNEKSGYKLDKDLYDFLEDLGDYQMDFGKGDNIGGGMNSPEEVETELKEVAKKLRIKLDL